MAGFEGRESVEQIKKETITLSIGQGSSTIATGLGIRDSFLKDLPKLGTLRVGDIFTLLRNTDGSGVLTKIRNATGEKSINEPYLLEKSAIYQDNEKGPENFAFIEFRRTPATHSYELVGSNGISLIQPPLRVLATNLDALRTEIGKKGAVFLTQCGVNRELGSLSCTIAPNKANASTVALPSTAWHKFGTPSLELAGIQQLLIDKNSYPDIIGAFTQSLFPQSMPPAPEVASIKKPRFSPN